ncbi:MAG TPA: S1/P1 nuclease [Rhizomicrobium sp.]|nr:S1/P1 nuclease [Rhizomicrobium sp.]
MREIPYKELFRLHFRQIPGLFARLLASLLIGLAGLAPLPARAWGPQGHEVVALIAEQQLSAGARTEVARLLGGAAMMVHDSNWADEIRDRRRETSSWHYVDIPLMARGYDPRRDCPDRNCAVAQIENNLRILANRRLGNSVRREALRFLIHFIADVHQPLHAEDNNDRGGNQVRVTIGRSRATLHRVWDSDVVEAMGRDSAGIAAGIGHSLSPRERKAWASGTVPQWANEAHAIARDWIYPQLQGRQELRLPHDYATRQAAIARMQLAKAGLRLAFLLNSNLK